MQPFTCPHCRKTFADGEHITKVYNLSLSQTEFNIIESGKIKNKLPKGAVSLILAECPACEEDSVFLMPYAEQPNFTFRFQYPPMASCVLPDYIPAPIRSDYVEAAAIVNLSPKASATLARRCLQGMIHDFWNIHEKNLCAEISSLQGKVPANQWRAIDATRKIGNIAAHMQVSAGQIVDVDPDEAQQLLRLIELLVKCWYIARHDEESLCNSIVEIAEKKKAK